MLTAKRRVRDLDVVLLSSDTAVNTGKDTLTVEFRAASTSELSMAGEWRLSLEWSGPAGQGSATFSLMVN